MAHPIIDSLPSFVRREASAHATASVLDLLPSSRVDTAQFGVADGQADNVIGRVADLSISPSGAIFVLDDRYNHVRVINLAGASRIVGRAGVGPGELASPRALALDGRRLLVLDSGRGVQVFEAVEAAPGEYGEWSFHGSWPLRTDFSDLCVMDGRTYLLGASPNTGHLVTILNAQGDSVGSFGDGYRHRDPWLRFLLNEGRLACGDGGVYVAFSRVPLVMAYSADGALKWAIALEPYHAGPILEDLRNGSVRTGLVPPDYSVADNLLTLELTELGILVQMAHHTVESFEAKLRWTHLESFLIDPQDATAVYLGESLPPVSAITANRLVAWQDDPYPRVTRYLVK